MEFDLDEQRMKDSSLPPPQHGCKRCTHTCTRATNNDQRHHRHDKMRQRHDHHHTTEFGHRRRRHTQLRTMAQPKQGHSTTSGGKHHKVRPPPMREWGPPSGRANSDTWESPARKGADGDDAHLAAPRRHLPPSTRQMGELAHAHLSDWLRCAARVPRVTGGPSGAALRGRWWSEVSGDRRVSVEDAQAAKWS